MKLFHDVETTGRLEKNLPLDHPLQPRIVQLGAMLTNDEGETASSVSLIVKPDGFEIPDGMVHGISQQYALAAGVPLRNVYSIFCHLAFAADELIAYNDEYDKSVLIGEALRMVQKNPFEKRATFCMMKAMTPVCQIPSPYRRGEFKWPSLTEAHVHCFGKPFDGAHNALADVEATRCIWNWFQTQKKGV